MSSPGARDLDADNRGQVREGWGARIPATSSDGCLILTIVDDGVGGAQPPVGATQNHAKIPVVETMTEEEKISLHHPRRHLDRYKRRYIGMTETVDIVPVMTKLSCFGIPWTTAPWILAMRDVHRIATLCRFGPIYDLLITIGTGVRTILISDRRQGKPPTLLAR